MNFLSELPNKIGYWLGFAIGSIVKFFKGCVDSFLEFIHKAWNFVTVDIPDIINEITDWFSKLPDKIWQWLSDTITKIQNWGTKTMSQAKEAGKNFSENVINFFKELPSNIGKWLTDMINKVTSWASNMAQKGKEMAIEMANNILNTIKELPSKVYSIGENIIRGIWNGISNMASWISGKIKGFCDNFVGGFKKALGINSPSKVFEENIGKNMALGIGTGFDSQIKQVVNRMKSEIPTDFDLYHEYDYPQPDTFINQNSNQNVYRFDEMDYMVSAFQRALTGMAFNVDEDKIGELIVNNVERVVFE